MSKLHGGRQGDMAAMARLLGRLGPRDDSADHKRRMVADLCRLLGREMGQTFPARVEEPGLTPRLRQTLQGLLAGESEKQIAARLGLSRNTIHPYVKTLYKHYTVCTRAELLARWVKR